MTLSQENTDIVARTAGEGSIVVLESGSFQAFISADEAIALFTSLGHAIRELQPYMCYESIEGQENLGKLQQRLALSYLSDKATD